MRITVVSILVALGCGGSSKSARKSEPPPTEHWETIGDWRYVYRGGCTIGPFEIELPAREELELGRRVAVLVYGPRAVRFDMRIESDRFETVGAMFVEEDDHSRCRVGEDDTAMPSVALVPRGMGKPGKPGKSRRPGKPGKLVEPPPPEPPPPDDDEEVAFVSLDEYTGKLPSAHIQVNARAYLPHGIPWIYADEYRTSYSKGRHGMASFRLRFWSERPQDMRGVIVRVLDQKLVPDLPLAEWHAQNAKRVAEAEVDSARRREYAQWKWEKYVARCKANPDDPDCKESNRSRGRMPPPPRKETPPPSPAPNVEWVAGYWSLDESLDDFVWIPGTFVVRAVNAPPSLAVVESKRPAPAASKPAPRAVRPADSVESPPPPPPPPPPAAVVEVEPARELEARVEAPPPPRVERLPPPPNVVGVVWVPGYWQLANTRWQWVPGRWLLPPRDHAYRVPSIQTRGRVRLYLPGGWIRRR